MSAAIEVRLARDDDRDRLIGFLRDHWRRDHVFVTAPQLFDWQYRGPEGRLNMILAETAGAGPAAGAGANDRVLGVLGFVTPGRFDAALGERDILLALWKVREDLAPPGLGLRLLKQVQARFGPRMIAAIGISAMVEPIYRALGYRTAAMDHLAVFNPDRRAALRLARGVPQGAFAAAPAAPSHRIEALPRGAARALRAAVDRLGAAAMPAKGWRYLEARFLDHPWYDYAVQGIFRADRLTAVIVWRRLDCAGARILRIVDMLGDDGWVAEAAALLRPVLRREAAEYIDLVSVGVPASRLAQGGFVGPAGAEGMVLPNHFAPYVAQNVAVRYAARVFAADCVPLRLFRADSDQDRPNLMAELQPERPEAP